MKTENEKGKSPEDEPPGLRLVHAGAIIFGKKCTACGGYLIVPRAGPEPETCSSRCRQKMHRLRVKASKLKAI